MIMNINFYLQDVVEIPSHLSLLQIVPRFVVDSTQQQQPWKIKGRCHNDKNNRLRSQVISKDARFWAKSTNI